MTARRDATLSSWRSAANAGFHVAASDSTGFGLVLEYLRILHLAASTMEADVEAALSLLLAEGVRITCDAVRRW